MNIIKVKQPPNGDIWINADKIKYYEKDENGCTTIILLDGSPIRVLKDITPELTKILKTINNGNIYMIS